MPVDNGLRADVELARLRKRFPGPPLSPSPSTYAVPAQEHPVTNPTKALAAPGFKRAASTVLVAALTTFSGCGGSGSPSTGPVGPGPGGPPVTTYVIPTMAPTFALKGDVSLVHDPSIISENGKYYVLSTDPGQSGQVGFLPILCSPDKLTWTRCGQVFSTLPASVQGYFAPAILTSLWAPDVSFFNGLYHVYFAASTFGSNKSMIGLATSPTMDPTSPNYGWTSQGIVLSSTTTSDFNAIDPSIWVDSDANGNTTHVWMSYGSFWNGIFQQEIDPASGLPSQSNTAVTQLATRPGVPNNPIEGSNMVKHNGFYYLFASFDYCCATPASQSNYKIAVGRSTSPQGPFLDMNGTSMLNGGGTILMEGGTTWGAPGGSTVLIDPVHGDLITYHALNLQQNGLDYLFVDSLTWPNDWPVITQ